MKTQATLTMLALITALSVGCRVQEPVFPDEELVITSGGSTPTEPEPTEPEPAEPEPAEPEPAEPEPIDPEPIDPEPDPEPIDPEPEPEPEPVVAGCAFAPEYCERATNFAPREGYFHIGVWDRGECAQGDWDMCPEGGEPVLHSDYSITPDDSACPPGRTYSCIIISMQEDCVISYSFHYCD